MSEDTSQRVSREPASDVIWISPPVAHLTAGLAVVSGLITALVLVELGLGATLAGVVVIAFPVVLYAAMISMGVRLDR